MSDLNNDVVNALKKYIDGDKAEAAKPAHKVEKAEKVCAAGEEMFSKVFLYKPKFGDFPVRVNKMPEDGDVARMIPKVDSDYVVQKEECAYLVAGLMDGDKTMLTGPTGSGKSSLVKYVAAKLNRPFIRINMSGDVESANMFGQLVVEDGATKWRDGAITEAARYGAICLVDEWELMSPEISMGLQNLLEEDGYLYLKEKPGTSADRTVVPHPDFRLVFAGNTVGQGDTTGAHNGVAVQNTATIDRFTNTIRLDYLTPSHEVAIITSKSGIKKEIAKDMVKVAALVRKAYNQGKLGLTMSPRTLINWGRKMTRFGDIRSALDISFMQKLSDDDRKVVSELFVKVFSSAAVSVSDDFVEVEEPTVD